MKLALGVFSGLVAAAVAGTLVAGWRWRADTAAGIARLDSGPGRAAPPNLEAALAGAPPPVARYLRATLGTRPGALASARIRQLGTFLVKPASNEWAPFEATQVFSTQPAGFVWDARIRMAPGVTTHVRDAFLDGRGIMRAAVWGAFTVVNAPPSPELDAGALQRYLGEAVWLPTALLPGDGLAWSALTDGSALATLTVGETTATLEFRFGADGLVSSVYTPARFREQDGRYVATPWEVRLERYQSHEGLMVPTEAEVAWILPERRQPYWRGTITDVQYTWVTP